MPDSHALLAAGLTYRQIDHWTKQGYLKPAGSTSGSGHPRQWSGEELRVARVMVQLLAAGFTVTAAHDVARRGPGAHDLGDTVRVVVREGVNEPWPASMDRPGSLTVDATPSTSSAVTTSVSGGSLPTTPACTSTGSTPAAGPTP